MRWKNAHLELENGVSTQEETGTLSKTEKIENVRNAKQELFGLILECLNTEKEMEVYRERKVGMKKRTE